MIDVDAIRSRWQQAETFLDERGRRLLAANEALAHGYGGVSAVARTTGLARSTINRGIRELRLGRNEIGSRVRRAGGGRKSAVAHQPDLPAALETLIEDAIRGDPLLTAALGEPQSASAGESIGGARLPSQPTRGGKAAAAAEL